MVVIAPNSSQQQRQDYSGNQTAVQNHWLNRGTAVAMESCDHSTVSSSSSSSSSTAKSPSSSSTTADSQLNNGNTYVHLYKKRELPSHSQYVAMDCEMVGSITGESICARVVLLDWKGRTIYDSFVAPNQAVADYRTFVSGITPKDLVDAPSLADVRRQVLQILRTPTGDKHCNNGHKIIIGHALENDLKSLQILDYPSYLIRDTAHYEPFQRKNHLGQLVPRKLKDLAAEKLNMTIQDLSKPHDPKEDALAALNLYKQHRPRWEACLSNTIMRLQKEQQRLQLQYLQQQQVLARQQQFHYYQMMMYRQQQQQHLSLPTQEAHNHKDLDSCNMMVNALQQHQHHRPMMMMMSAPQQTPIMSVNY